MRRLNSEDPETGEPVQEDGFHGVDPEKDRLLKERLKNGEQIPLNEALSLLVNTSAVGT